MSSENECCENCASAFSLFKRKKTCSLCNQSFCHFCLSRRNSADQASATAAGNQENQSQQTNERICNICRTICHPQTTTDDLMKLKLKHLKCVLNKANIQTNTCKDKRDLAELIVRNQQKFRAYYTPNRPADQPFNGQQQQQQQQQQQPASGFPFNNNFNHTFNNLMNNVQDFVNGNIINSTSQRSSTTNTNTNNNRHQQPPNNSTNTSTSTSTSSTSTSNNQPPNTNFTIPNNFTSSVLNFIGEQVPNVIQQTFNNFNLNNNNSNNGNAANPPHANRTNAPRRSSGASQTNGHAQPRTNSANYQRQGSEPQAPPRSESNHQSMPNRGSNSQATTQNATTNLKRRASLSDIKCESDIDQLNIKQIKEILATNFVEYKGCCEKKELVEKIKRLYASHLENKRLEGQLNGIGDDAKYSSVLNDENNPTSTLKSDSNNNNGVKRKPDESDLCKICMESLIECVLLDCGHMCSCIKCGKQLAECPICRQNVVRVIRVFKS